MSASISDSAEISTALFCCCTISRLKRLTFWALLMLTLI